MSDPESDPKSDPELPRFVMTLVTADHTAEEPVGGALACLRTLGASLGTVQWLAETVACDLPFTGALPAAAESAVRLALRGLPVDVAVQTTENRRKKLLVADMESTVIRNELLEELADFVGVRQRVEDITRRTMNGELDFRASLSQRVALIEGLRLTALEECLEVIRFDPGVRSLVATSRAHGAYTALVSGGFTFFADWVMDRVGFDEAHANVLGTANGRLTGRVLEPILDRDAKARTLGELCARLGIQPADAATVGDGDNDLPMLQAAGLGVAFHGKPSVARAARFRIDHGDLTTLLYFQGYRTEEIKTADS